MRSFLRGARESVRRLVAFAQAEGWSVDRSAGGREAQQDRLRLDLHLFHAKRRARRAQCPRPAPSSRQAAFLNQESF